MAFFGDKRLIKALYDAFLTDKQGRVIGVELSGQGAGNPTYLANYTTDRNNKPIPGAAPFPCVVYQTAVPVILAPSGTIATNGVVTLGTALPTIYANAWCYFPAAMMSAGLAGLYFVKFSSTTVGQVYTNFVDASTTAFTPYIPSNLVAGVGNNGAYTQTTASNLTLANVTIAGGSMGLNGKIRTTPKFALLNNANSKVLGQFFGGANLGLSNNFASVAGAGALCSIINRGVTNAQLSSGNIGDLGSTIPLYGTIDTSINQPLTLTGQLATATDYIILEAFTVEVLPA